MDVHHAVQASTSGSSRQQQSAKLEQEVEKMRQKATDQESKSLSDLLQKLQSGKIDVEDEEGMKQVRRIVHSCWVVASTIAVLTRVRTVPLRLGKDVATIAPQVSAVWGLATYAQLEKRWPFETT